ncbi:helix-turn-helix domain-containing protein [Capillimicrobium parvum]|uniref:GAF domain-containing protein n=1 Tax=Capillimicrobium parvum TaxID=2884022 RepID=A0A9E6XUF0_9ACTN|nr:helix-turn-helix domain-containing protein [Capillimicrobium parvum]UGS34375.1 hypothetical protein DSM104329_00753 [Capillimicrobium parvum]
MEEIVPTGEPWAPGDNEMMIGAVARSALEAARTVLAADFCAFAWLTTATGPPEVVASNGISDDRARSMAETWLAAIGVGDESAVRRLRLERMSPMRRIEPVRDAAGRPRGVLVATFTGSTGRPRDARVLMPVFAYHLGLLLERIESQARRTASYEALVQIGMQIQAQEADVEKVLHLIVERARELVGTDVAWMGLVDEEAGTLDMSVASGARTRRFMEMQLRLGEGVGGLVVASRRPVVVPDYRADSPPSPRLIRAAVLGEGIGSMLCAPMLTGDKVIGALYVGSRHAVDFSAAAAALTGALAAQGAVAVENGRLYADLQRKNRLLEQSSTAHRALTDAALAGAGLADIVAGLARLLNAAVTLTQDVVEPHRVCCRADGSLEPDGGDLEQPALSFPIVGEEELGRLTVLGVEHLTALQANTVEHGATVLALELVKQRAAQDVEWRLQGELLNELLDAPVPTPATLVSRARRHGIDLSRPHRVIAVTPASGDDAAPAGADLLSLVRRATGRTLVHRDAALVHLRGDHVLLATPDDPDGTTSAPVLHAISRAVEGTGGHVAIGVGELTGEFGVAHRQAVACAMLARGDGRASRILQAEQLGPLRFVLEAPDLVRLRSIVAGELAAISRYDGDGRTELFTTLRAFIAADGNVAATANACFVHKNTLRYRLQRAAQVIGRDPSDPDVKFELRIAFGLLDLFRSLGIDLLDPTESPAPAPNGAAVRSSGSTPR